MIIRKSASLALFLALINFAAETRGHQAEQHDGKKRATLNTVPHGKVGLELIQKSYLSNVRPIFKRSCFDCHSSSQNFPWYSNLPLVRNLIQSDILEAKKHLDITNDFPFGGHGSPEEDLKAIDEVVSDGNMPPARYRFMHPSAKLSQAEIAKVRKWASEGLKQLSK